AEVHGAGDLCASLTARRRQKQRGAKPGKDAGENQRTFHLIGAPGVTQPIVADSGITPPGRWRFDGRSQVSYGRAGSAIAPPWDGAQLIAPATTKLSRLDEIPVRRAGCDRCVAESVRVALVRALV